MADLATLRRKRGAIQATITIFTKILDDWTIQPDLRDSDYVQASLEGMQLAFSNFPKLQDEIEELNETELTHRFELEDRFNTALGRARKLLRERGPAASAAGSRASTPMSISTPIPASLPQVTLPKFDGSPEGWASFYDIFSSLIDKNESLPPVRKLQYLRLSLTGRAASAIESLETTENNYSIALDTLKKKFECTRRTLRRHWNILREYQRLPRDTPSALHSLVDTVYQHTRALENLKAPVSSWDIPLIDLILSKVSQSTALQWELTLQDDNMPTYKHLLEFLEKRANCSDFAYTSEPTQVNNPSTTRSGDSKKQKGKTNHGSNKAQAFATRHEPRTCPICEEDHRIYACERFKSMTTDQRQKAVANASLCYNCLGKGHGSRTCKAGSCRTCQGRHHTFLHKTGGNPQAAVEPAPSNSTAPQADPPSQA